MSETQKLIGNQNSNPFPSVQEDWNSDDLTVDSDLMGEGFDDNNDASSQAHVTLDQIKDLERKVSSQKNLFGKDNELLSILGEAEKEELLAERNEKFSSDSLRRQAEDLHQKVDQLYQGVALKVKEAERVESQGATDTTDVQPNLSKEERKKMADQITAAAEKVGYVGYLYQEKDNDEAMGWQILQCVGGVLTCGMPAPVLETKDYSAKAYYNVPYTVGIYNTNNHEFATHLPVTGRKVHLDGANITQEDYAALQAQGQAEAEDVKALLPKFARALQENDPEKQKKLWAQIGNEMDAWNTKNQDKATVYHRAQLMFNTLIGELGQATFQKAIQTQAIPSEFCNKLGQLLESQPKEEKDQVIKDQGKSNYFRGGASDMNWDNVKCSRFMSGDFLYQPIEEEKEDTQTSNKSEKKSDDKTSTPSN